MPDDVDDGVVPADLVEVHLVDRAAVQRRFHVGQAAEDGERPLGHPGRQAASVIRAAMWAWVRTTHVVAAPHQGPGAGHAAPERLLHLELPAGQGRRCEEEADLVEVGSGIDEGAERHVAGDAGEAVEPGDGPVSAGRCAGADVGTDVGTHVGLTAGAGRWRRRRRSRCRCRPR